MRNKRTPEAAICLNFTFPISEPVNSTINMFLELAGNFPSLPRRKSISPLVGKGPKKPLITSRTVFKSPEIMGDVPIHSRTLPANGGTSHEAMSSPVSDNECEIRKAKSKMATRMGLRSQIRSSEEEPSVLGEETQDRGTNQDESDGSGSDTSFPEGQQARGSNTVGTPKPRCSDGYTRVSQPAATHANLLSNGEPSRKHGCAIFC